MAAKYLSYYGILVNVIIHGPPSLDPLARLLMSMLKSGKNSKDEIALILADFNISQSIIEAVIEECIAKNYLVATEEDKLQFTDQDPDGEFDYQTAKAIWDPYRKAFLPTLIQHYGELNRPEGDEYIWINNSLIDLSKNKFSSFLPKDRRKIQSELHPISADPNARLISIDDLKKILNDDQHRTESNEPFQDQNMMLNDAQQADDEIDALARSIDVETELHIQSRQNKKLRHYNLGTRLTPLHHILLSEGAYKKIPLYVALEYTGLHHQEDKYNFLVNQSALTPILSESAHVWHHWDNDLCSNLTDDEKVDLSNSLTKLWYDQRAVYQAEQQGISAESVMEADAQKSNAVQDIKNIIKNEFWKPADLIDLYGEIIYNSSLGQINSYERAAMHSISDWVETFMCKYAIKIPQFDFEQSWNALTYDQMKDRAKALRLEGIKSNPIFFEYFKDNTNALGMIDCLYGMIAPFVPSMKKYSVKSSIDKKSKNMHIGDSMIIFSAALVLCEGQTLKTCRSALQHGHDLLPLLDRLREDRNNLSHTQQKSRRSLPLIVADIKSAWSICSKVSLQ